MRIIIAGSRTISDYGFIKSECTKIIKMLKTDGHCTKRESLQIISGTANGADKLGEHYAREFNLEIIRFPADWDGQGRRAGYVRNANMAKYASEDSEIGVLIAFWDGMSKGTKHMIDLATKSNLRVFIVKIGGNHE